jgi:hypothetical protein
VEVKSMNDELLARDGFSQRPPLLRALALSLIAGVVVLADVPLWLPTVLVLGAVREWSIFARRRRARLDATRAS